MSKEHTPGPWKVTEEDVRGDDIYYRVEKEGFGLIALVDATPDCIELRANARLIAAAPALLEASKWLYGQWLAYADQRYLTPDEKKRKEQAKAAIKKAEEK